MLLLNIITPQQQQALFANLLEVIEAHKGRAHCRDSEYQSKVNVNRGLDLNDALQPIRESDPSYQRLGSVFNDWVCAFRNVLS
jgi:hypothetical protein